MTNGFAYKDEYNQYQYQDETDNESCYHMAIVSISDKECQCMDCLMKWEKREDFKSDFPKYDRG